MQNMILMLFHQLETELQTDINFNHQLVDIAQLDGVADSSSDTEEDDDDDDDDDLGLVGENEFLGMINGNGEEELEEEEVMRALTVHRWPNSTGFSRAATEERL